MVLEEVLSSGLFTSMTVLSSGSVSICWSVAGSITIFSGVSVLVGRSSAGTTVAGTLFCAGGLEDGELKKRK